MYTVGCKGEKSMQHELLDAGVPADTCMLIDCSDFRGARATVEWHWGASTRVLVNILDLDRPMLKDVFGRVCKNLKNAHVPILNLVFFCSHGKHRSVGVATLVGTSRACNRWCIKDTKPLMQQYWYKKKKGHYTDCPECLEGNDTNQKCYKDALELFKQEFHVAIQQ